LNKREVYAVKQLRIINHLEKNLDNIFKDKFYQMYKIMLYLSFIKYSCHINLKSVKLISSELIKDKKELRSLFKLSILFAHNSFKRSIVLYLLGTNGTSFLVRKISRMRLRVVKF